MCKYCRQDWRKFKYSFLNLRMLLITERNRASGLEQSLGHSTAFVFSVQRKMVFVKCRLQALGLYISVRDFRKGIYTEGHISEGIYKKNWYTVSVAVIRFAITSFKLIKPRNVLLDRIHSNTFVGEGVGYILGL